MHTHRHVHKNTLLNTHTHTHTRTHTHTHTHTHAHTHTGTRQVVANSPDNLSPKKKPSPVKAGQKINGKTASASINVPLDKGRGTVKKIKTASAKNKSA